MQTTNQREYKCYKKGIEIMNQTTNLIQWKNLTEEQKADFDFDNYKYVLQDIWGHWVPLLGDGAGASVVYRLVIEPEKWYYCADEFGSDVRLGENLPLGVETLRPAKPHEIPQPEKTLEQRIQEKWPDKRVIKLNWDIDKETGEECLFVGSTNKYHVAAQSMKGFYNFVYEISGRLEDYSMPVKPFEIGPIHPVAFLTVES